MKLFFIIYVLFTQGNIYFFKNSCIVELKIQLRLQQGLHHLVLTTGVLQNTIVVKRSLLICLVEMKVTPIRVHSIEFEPFERSQQVQVYLIQVLGSINTPFNP